MRVETFSEDYSGQGGFFREMDARLKLVFCACCLVLSVGSSGASVPVFAGAICAVLLFISGAPARAVALRSAEPLVFALFMATAQCFLVPGTAAAGLDLAGLHLTATHEGMARGGYILARVFGAVMVVLFVTMTTPADRLLSAAAWMRLPRGFVEITMFAYRYVFVLIEDAVTVYHSQRGRLGYAGIRTATTSIGTLAGSVFYRAFNQAEATGVAMAQRGYTGSYVPAFHGRVRPLDAAVLGGIAVAVSAVFLWTL